MLNKVVFSLFFLSLGVIGPAAVEAVPFQFSSPYPNFSPSLHQFAGAVYSPQNDCIQIEDGSQWQINPRDYHKLRMWEAGDILELFVNRPWFTTSQYEYYIQNLTRASSIEANLFTAPLTEGPYTRWIHAFNKSKRTLFLNDGSSWEIEPEDAHIFDKWKGNDLIIIGKEIYMFSLYDYVLINVNHNEFIPAKKL